MKNKKVLLIFFVIILIVVVLLFIIPKNNVEVSNENVSQDDDVDDSLDYVVQDDIRVKLNVTDSYVDYLDVSIKTGKLLGKISRYTIDNGNEVLDDSYKVEEKIFSIYGDVVKTLYYEYNEVLSKSVIYCLTKSGNIYIDEFYTADNTIEILDEFKRMDYIKVKKLVRVKNDNYGSLDQYDIVDDKEYILYALIDKELVKVEK